MPKVRLFKNDNHHKKKSDTISKWQLTCIMSKWDNSVIKKVTIITNKSDHFFKMTIIMKKVTIILNKSYNVSTISKNDICQTKKKKIFFQQL